MVELDHAGRRKINYLRATTSATACKTAVRPPLELRARVYIRVPASVARFPRSKRREGELRTVSLLGGGEIEDGTSYHVWPRWTPSFSLPSRLYIRTLPTVHFFPSLSISYRRVITRREHAPRILLLLGLGQPIYG